MRKSKIAMQLDHTSPAMILSSKYTSIKSKHLVTSSAEREPNMNELFIRSNPVMPDSRVEKEIRALTEAGYTVALLAWDRSADYRLRKEPLNKQMPNVNAFRIGIKAPYGSGIKNILRLLQFQCVIREYLKNNTYGNYSATRA